MAEFREWLHSLSDEHFWTKQFRPDYKNIQFLWAEELYPAGAMPTRAFLSRAWPNPSSFQRWVSKEARRRDSLLKSVA